MPARPLRRNQPEIHASLAAEKLDERDGELPRHDLAAVSLDDPRQWSMSWTTLPDVYHLGLPHLEEWAATVDVTQPDKATEAFFPTISSYGRSYNLLLTRKVRRADIGTWRDLFGAAWTPALDTAAGAGLLYVIDLRIYESLHAQQFAGSSRFTPSTVTVLVHDAATKALTPSSSASPAAATGRRSSAGTGRPPPPPGSTPSRRLRSRSPSTASGSVTSTSGTSSPPRC